MLAASSRCDLSEIMAEQTERANERGERSPARCVDHTYQHEHLESIGDVSATLLEQVEQFFISYNRQRGKVFKVTATSGPKRAVKLLEAGIHLRARPQLLGQGPWIAFLACMRRQPI